MASTPEHQARAAIDALLLAAGWSVQDMAAFDRHAAIGMAVREFPVASGPCDCPLVVTDKACGVIEAGVGVTEHGSSWRRLVFAQRVRQCVATALRHAILRSACSGHLMPQGPNNEPASALLTRLTAQACQRPAAPRRRGRKAAA